MPYSIEFLADLDRTLARSRISRYLTATGGDLDQALQLYEKNVAVSEALFGILHGVEVSVRNSLHNALSTDIGVEDWYQNGLPLPFPAMPQLTFTAPMRNMLDKARRNVGPSAPVGKLVAELTFGFCPSSYLASITTSGQRALTKPSLMLMYPDPLSTHAWRRYRGSATGLRTTSRF